MKWLTLLFFFAMPVMAEEKIDCKKDKLYCKILKLKPKVNKKWAKEFSDKLYKHAKEYHMDPTVSLAILMQESSLENLNTFTSQTTMQKSCGEKSCTKTIVEVKKAVDLSIAQINVNTAAHYGLDLERLFSLDEDYALESHFIILRDKIKLCLTMNKVDYPWSCYHSTNDVHRLKYVDLVKRYMN